MISVLHQLGRLRPPFLCPFVVAPRSGPQVRRDIAVQSRLRGCVKQRNGAGPSARAALQQAIRPGQAGTLRQMAGQFPTLVAVPPAPPVPPGAPAPPAPPAAPFPPAPPSA